jgi:cyclase
VKIKDASIPLMRLIAALVCLIWIAQAQQQPDYDKVEIQAKQISSGFYVLFGAGGNIGVSVGNDGILLVDNQYTPLYGKITAALKRISDRPIRFVVNTHWHGDHIGGNQQMAKNGTVIVAHDNVRTRLINQRSNPNADWRNPPMPDGTLPVVTYKDAMTLHFNDEEVDILHVDLAHTDGDSFVYFRKENILHTGDLFGTGRYPVFIPDNGGSTQGILTAMERIIKTANAATKIVPGHGIAPVTVKEVQEQHDMLAAIRDRILAGVRAGRTLEQIMASKPTAEFDDHNKAGRTAEEFVTLVYSDLTKGQTSRAK